MTVASICCRNIDVAKAFESVQAAAARMHDRNVGTLVVVNDMETPIGIVTDRDIVVRVVGVGRDPSQTSVQDVMSTSLVSVTESCAIETALQTMRIGPYRRLLVMAEDDNRLVGIVSVDDVLAHLAEEFCHIGDLLYCESPESLDTPTAYEAK